jgi:hypothetical protein
VSEVADRNAGVALKINKERLQVLPAAAATAVPQRRLLTDQTI